MKNFENESLISIALATYNGAAFLRLQLQSILDQTHQNIELVISDDGSTDDTVSIIREFQRMHSNIVLIHNNEGKGIRINFENALRNCRGRLIALCDQDDIWLPEKLQLLFENIGPASLIYHNSLFIDEAGNSLKRTVMDKLCGYEGSDVKVFLLFNCVSGHACLFKRELLTQALPFPEARFHDWWLAFVAAAENGVKYLPVALAHYRQHSTSKTDILKRKKETKHTKEFLRWAEELRWFESCARLDTREKLFFSKWAELYKKRNEQWLSVSLFILAYKNRRSLFEIPKKSNFGKFLILLRFLWGMKLKTLIS